MARTLILVPKMYSRNELRELLGRVPADFEATSTEFWDYVAEKLTPFASRVQVVYAEPPVQRGPKSRFASLLTRMLGDGAVLRGIDDPLLAAEVDAWQELMRSSQNRAVVDLWEASLDERNAYARTVIDSTLEDRRLGVLFAEPGREVPLPEDVRVIRMCPFDPVDYVNRHRVRAR